MIPARVHLGVAAAFLAAAVATLAALDAIGRASANAGTVWIFAASGAGPAIGALPPAADARVLDVLAGGLVVRVHVRALSAASVPGAWTLRWPAADLGWPACG